MRLRCCFVIVAALLAGAAGGSEALYKYDAGPYEVRIIDALTLTDAVQQRDVTLRVLYPDGDGPFPLVVFSTGAFCWPQMYDLITSHWVSHGYVVIQPNHLDSPNNAAPPRPDQYADMQPSRVRDVSFVLDELDEISARAGIPGRISGDRVAISGHSFGAVIAMIKTGLTVTDEFIGSWGQPYDDRFQAAVLLSAPGANMKEIAEDGYENLRKPLIATGGTNDVGRVDPGEYTPAEWRTLAYTLAPSGDKYSLITEGSDHYMGGLICNPDRGGEPDPESVAIVRAVTLAFLDAYIKSDAAAMTYLKTADVLGQADGRATYKFK